MHTSGASDPEHFCSCAIPRGNATNSGSFCRHFLAQLVQRLIRAMAAISVFDAVCASRIYMTYLWKLCLWKPHHSFQRHVEKSRPVKTDRWNFHCIKWRRNVRSFLRGIGCEIRIQSAQIILCVHIPLGCMEWVT